MTATGARRVAWVTGASRGMGANTAVELARAGFDVALTARDQARLEAVADQVRAAGGAALPVSADLADRASVSAFAEAAVDRFGRCDVLCNIGVYQGPAMATVLLDTSLDELAASLEADVVAPALLCRRALPLMLEHGRGTIVNMSSGVATLQPRASVATNGWSFAYAAGKAGIDRLAGIVNAELGDRGIRAFTVEPGIVAYGEKLAEYLEKYSGAPVSPPESIGPAIVWLVDSPDADELLPKRINLPGLTHRYGLLPGWEGPGSPVAG
ncbi:SDR family NAD(P)-dependent oxidoreductase [Trujillonella endophytica]|uniref:Short chain dehydrogenase n=1 Tax=Trujillonella endophytica TaxID=673521 RepID=A0A1H8US51_9ACTN|nr:SDR family oxidoreductase [Trujillella endophytica]SEP05418.1 short chain dehydrogenase [Trujillella endophytica]